MASVLLESGEWGKKWNGPPGRVRRKQRFQRQVKGGLAIAIHGNDFVLVV